MSATGGSWADAWVAELDAVGDCVDAAASDLFGFVDWEAAAIEDMAAQEIAALEGLFGL